MLERLLTNAVQMWKEGNNFRWHLYFRQWGRRECVSVDDIQKWELQLKCEHRCDFLVTFLVLAFSGSPHSCQHATKGVRFWYNLRKLFEINDEKSLIHMFVACVLRWFWIESAEWHVESTSERSKIVLHHRRLRVWLLEWKLIFRSDIFLLRELFGRNEGRW